MSESTKQTATADQAPAASTPAPKTATAKQAPAPGAERPEGAPEPEPTHTVAKGETLEKIAEKLKTTPAELQRVNAIKRPELIWPGMELRLR